MKDYIDPISLEFFRDPITIPQSGMIYQRKPLKEWITRHKTCPLTKKPLRQTITLIDSMSPSIIIKNKTEEALKKILQKLKTTRKQD